MQDKIKIIDEIVKRHPSAGVDKGYSEYTGGMTDSGTWHFRKMLDVPIEELKSFLDKLIFDENNHQTESKPTGDVFRIVHNSRSYLVNEMEFNAEMQFRKMQEEYLDFMIEALDGKFN